jgi:hypothetical protein
VQADFIDLILGAPAVTAAVGTKVYWARRPQGALAPLILMHVISELPDFRLGGVGSHRRTRVQIDCYGTTYADARAGAAAVKTLLNGYTGTVGGTRIQGVFQDSERDMTEGGDTATERLFRVSMDFFVNWHAVS